MFYSNVLLTESHFCNPGTVHRRHFKIPLLVAIFLALVTQQVSSDALEVSNFKEAISSQANDWVPHLHRATFRKSSPLTRYPSLEDGSFTTSSFGSSAVASNQGIISTFAGNGFPNSSGDNGPATAASLADPTGIAVDALTGNLYIVGYMSNRIRMVSKTTGIITTVAGNGYYGYSGDGGPATLAQLNAPTGVGIDSTRRLIYIADNANNAVRMIDMSSGNITTVAGGGLILVRNADIEASYGYYGTYPIGNGDGGPATSATLSNPTRNVVDLASGNIYIAESGRSCIRLVTKSTGIISTVAGTGILGYTGDGGRAIDATLQFPTGIALDPDTGDLYIADSGNNCIRVVKKSNNIISTVAGYVRSGYRGDGGLATSAALFDPRGVTVSASSRLLYIADSGNNCIRMVALSTGIITTVAGTGLEGYSGDGGEAIYASLYSPFSVATDPSSGVIYIADSFNYVVRSMNGTTTGSPRPSVAPTYSALPMTASPSVLAPSMNPTPIALNSIRTFAGTGKGGYMGDGGQARAAELSIPGGLAVDESTGDVYIVDELNSCVRMVSKSGIITTVAGIGGSTGFRGDDGPATSSLLYYPSGVSLNTDVGIMFISDTFNNRIRMVTKRTGTITTLAGNGAYGFSGDGGPAIAASLASPSKTAVDPVSGNVYIADSGNSRIRMVTASNGIISTVAGNGQFGYAGDGGPAISAPLGYPSGLAIETSSGNLYISDIVSNCIRMMTKSTGFISTVAGSGAYGYSGDGGVATAASLKSPAGIALDAVSGDLFISGAGSGRIRMVLKSTGNISTVAGTGRYGYTGDGGLATNASFAGPVGVALDASSGIMYIADSGNNVVRAVSRGITVSPAPSTATVPAPSTNMPIASPTGNSSQPYEPSSAPTKYGDSSAVRIIATAAGTSAAGYSGDGGDASAAQISFPAGIAVERSTGNVYIADTLNNRIRMITKTTGVISTVAGTTGSGYGGDNAQAVSAVLNGPCGVAVDQSTGNVYIADTLNNRIRMITKTTGVISTVAGTGEYGYYGRGGQATLALLNNPTGVTVHPTSGNLYIADSGNFRIRMVSKKTGIIITVAGNGVPGYSGDGGPAVSATLSRNSKIAIEASSGNIYIADAGNNRVRMITKSSGVISTVAGTGVGSHEGDNAAATLATLFGPSGVALDTTGNLYIADANNNCIRMVTKSTGIITTVAGTGVTGYTGDGGSATLAELTRPSDLDVDAAGRLFVCDTYNSRVRSVSYTQSVLFVYQTITGVTYEQAITLPFEASLLNTVATAVLVVPSAVSLINYEVAQNRRRLLAGVKVSYSAIFTTVDTEDTLTSRLSAAITSGIFASKLSNATGISNIGVSGYSEKKSSRSSSSSSSEPSVVLTRMNIAIIIGSILGGCILIGCSLLVFKYFKARKEDEVVSSVSGPMAGPGGTSTSSPGVTGVI